MPIVAMTREMGALGTEVAAQLKEHLGVPIVYHEIIDVLADRMRVRKSHVVRLLDGRESLLDRLTADRTSLAIFTAAEICAVALKGNGAIFRGWGAVHVLKGAPQVVRVRIHAPMELRVRRMMQRLNTADDAAVIREIRDSDEAQTAIVRRNFDADWTDASHYDLVLDSGQMSVAQCADAVLALVRSERFAETTAAKQALADLALQTAVRAALRVHPKTRPLRILVSVAQGNVTLAGIVSDESAAEHAQAVAAAAANGGTVRNHLRSESGVRARYA